MHTLFEVIAGIRFPVPRRKSRAKEYVFMPICKKGIALRPNALTVCSRNELRPIPPWPSNAAKLMRSDAVARKHFLAGPMPRWQVARASPRHRPDLSFAGTSLRPANCSQFRPTSSEVLLRLVNKETSQGTHIKPLQINKSIDVSINLPQKLSTERTATI